MRNYVAAAALAAFFVLPAQAHEQSTMNTENEMFAECTYVEGSEGCELKREYMPCEPAAKYEHHWGRFFDANGMPSPYWGAPVIHEDHGYMDVRAVEVDEHYDHIYAYISDGDEFCLVGINHRLTGDPA